MVSILKIKILKIPEIKINKAIPIENISLFSGLYNYLLCNSGAMYNNDPRIVFKRYFSLVILSS